MNKANEYFQFIKNIMPGEVCRIYTAQELMDVGIAPNTAALNINLIRAKMPYHTGTIRRKDTGDVYMYNLGAKQ